ncbi:MAG: 50S ribosomal protein L29 [Alphaproteobacteria bacterium]|nr:MAG: 50S ribosomal protein L29 [Alphaproteobacteria bacterium]
MRKKSLEDIQKHVVEKNRELLNLRFRKSSGDLDKTHQLRSIRREIARFNTVALEKKS